MAPLDPDATARSRLFPVALFSGQVLLVAGLTTQVLLTARRAAKTIPPSASTRSQQPVRRDHAVVFSVLALLSLVSVTVFAVVWRGLSYIEWAEQGNHETPGSLWTGWYGTGDEGVGRWRLGDWLADVNLVKESDSIAVAQPEAFLYTAQHYVTLLATAIFMGVEGRRRNIPTATIASFVLLCGTGSLAYALNLFFITILYTPLAHHSGEPPRHDTLFAPKAAVFYVPALVSLLGLNALPGLLSRNADVGFLRFGYLAVPLFLAFAQQVVPVSWGRHHASKAAAHQSFSKVFWVLSLASLFLHWKIFGFAFFVNTPPEQGSVYDLLKNAIGKKNPTTTNRLLAGLSITAQKLKLISKHPSLSVTTLDVIFTTISLLAWAFIRDLDVEAILHNSVLSFLVPQHKEEKHVAIDAPTEEVTADEAEVLPTETPKKRGRPRKGTLTNGATTSTADASSTGTGTVRRSTRKKTPARSDHDSEAEATFQPSAAAKSEIQQTESDGTSTAADLVSGGEATAVALCLGFLGGLGQLAGGVLGAEVGSVGE